MHNDPFHRQDEQHPHPDSIATTRQRSRSRTREPARQSRPDPRRWALVQAWNDVVLATFAEEAGAREAIGAADDDANDDEVVSP